MAFAVVMATAEQKGWRFKKESCFGVTVMVVVVAGVVAAGVRRAAPWPPPLGMVNANRNFCTIVSEAPSSLLLLLLLSCWYSGMAIEACCKVVDES